MKKLISLIGLLLLVVVAIAIYRFSFRKSIPEASVDEQVAAILEQNGCYECHNAEAELPFYASLPGGSMLTKHVTHGTRFIDLKAQDLKNPSEVLLSMIEYTVQHGNMPIAEYKLAHWGTGYNAEENSLLTEWIIAKRKELYSTGLNGELFANEPVQALPDAVETDPRKVALGKKMYNDVRLSLDGTLSCATCHVIEKGGADPRGTRTSEGINGQFGGINAPTVLNALFNVEQFWNGRAHTLADQAAGPPANPVEMGDQTWEQICARLSEDAELVAEFQAIYPEGITQASVTDAIGEFEKTLITANDRFDQYLKGVTAELTADEIEGYNLFKDNTCATCHVGKTLGGQSFERLGIFEDYFAVREKTHPDIAFNDDDKGRAGFTGNDADLYRFKVPTMRNLSQTAPYFHDGSRAIIEEAVEAMFRFELGKTADQDVVNKISAFLRSMSKEN